MNKFTFVALVLFFLSFAAESRVDHQASPEEIATGLRQTQKYHQDLQRHGSPQPNITPFRPSEDTANFAYVLMSEQEPSEEISFLRKTIAQNLPASVKLVILADTQDVDAVKTEYAPWISPDRLLVVSDASTENGLWARDAFPVPVFDSVQKNLSLVAAKYYREFDSGDAIATGVSAPHLAKKDFTFVGGNLIADEDGVCFSVDSYRLFGTTAEDIVAAYGCKTHHMMPHKAGIGDVDEVLKPLSAHRILTNVPEYQASLESWGYQVILLPSAPDYRTYANSLIVKDTVFMPSYNLPADAQAQAIYENLGYKVILIPSEDLSENMHGSIHCQTMAYPAMDPRLSPAEDAKLFVGALKSRIKNHK